MKRRSISLSLATACLAVAGCGAHYVTPQGGASLVELASVDVRSYYESKPASPFPASIAIVRVQDHGFGEGRYKAITTRDLEDRGHYDRMAGLPLVRGVVPVGRMLVPANAATIRDLRAPAAMLHADLLLIYSVDTVFTVEGRSLGPLSAISLGLIRNQKAHVTATVAGVLVDVRTGYVYGTTEATAKEEQRATIWSTERAIESSRMRAEQTAFDDFVDEFGHLWKGVVDVHAATSPAGLPPVAATPAIEDRDTHYRIRFSD